MIKDVQMILVGAALGLAGMLAIYGSTPADAAKPSFIRDNCKNMSGNDGGLQCRGSDYLLIRWPDALGICGPWKCCPPNGDGSYDCNRAETPTRKIRDKVGGAVGTRPGTADPGPRTTSPAAPKPGSTSPN